MINGTSAESSKTRRGSRYFGRSKSRREYAARGFLLSLFTGKGSKRHPFGSKWEKRGPQGNLGRRIFARWHAFSPVKNAEIPVVRDAVCEETMPVRHDVERRTVRMRRAHHATGRSS